MKVGDKATWFTPVQVNGEEWYGLVDQEGQPMQDYPTAEAATKAVEDENIQGPVAILKETREVVKMGDKTEVTAELEVFLMSDQPETCPKCGTRVDIVRTGRGDDGEIVQEVLCPGCGFRYIVEEDLEDEDDE